MKLKTMLMGVVGLAVPLATLADSTYSTYSNDTDTPSAGGAYTDGQRFQLNATWMFNTDGDDLAATDAAVGVSSIAVKWASNTHANADIGHNRGGEQPDSYLVVTTPQDVILGVSSVNDVKWTVNGTSTYTFSDLVLASNAQYVYYFATDVSGLTVGAVLPSSTKKNGRILGAWHGGGEHTSDSVVHINGNDTYSIQSIFTVTATSSTALATGTDPVALSAGNDPVVVTGAVADGVVAVDTGVAVPSLTVIGEATTLKLADSLTASYLYLPATTTIDATDVTLALPGEGDSTAETILVSGKISSAAAPAVTLPTVAEGFNIEPLVRDDTGIKVIVSKPVDATVTLVEGQELLWSQVKPQGWVNSAVPVINVDNTVAGTLIFDEDVQAARIHTTNGSAVNFVRGSGVNVSIPLFSAGMTYMRTTFTDFAAIPQTNHETDATDQITASGTATLTSFPQINTGNQGAVLVVDQPTTLSDSTGFYVTGSKTIDINSGANISATRFVLGNNGGVTQMVNQNGGSVTVTGTAAPTANTASILLGHWGNSSSSTLKTLGGTFTANNVATRLGWDGTATWQIGGGDSTARVNVYGIVNGGNGHGGSGTLNIMGNGTLNLGAGGINFSSSGNGGNINLAGGTIDTGAAAVTIANEKAGGTIINQNKTTTVNVDAEKTLTVNAVLSGQGVGTLAKTGDGTLVLARTATTKGKLLVSAGTVVFNEGISWGTNGSVEIGADGTLNVLTAEDVAQGGLLVAGSFTVNGTVLNNGEEVEVAVTTTGIYVGEAPAVAMIGTTKYSTLEDAFAAVDDDDTLTLIGSEVTIANDVTVSKSFTLAGDAEGTSVSGTGRFLLTSSAELTLDATVTVANQFLFQSADAELTFPADRAPASVRPLTNYQTGTRDNNDGTKTYYQYPFLMITVGGTGVTLAYAEGATINGVSVVSGTAVVAQQIFEGDNLVFTATPAAGYTTPVVVTCNNETLTPVDGKYTVVVGTDNVAIAASATEVADDYPTYIDSTDAAAVAKYTSWAEYAGVTATEAEGLEDAYLLNCTAAEVADAKAAFVFTAIYQDSQGVWQVETTTSYNGRDYNGAVTVTRYSDVTCTTEAADGSFFRATLQ